MNDAIIITYNPYEIESSVSIFRDGTQEFSSVYSDTQRLANDIIGLAYKNNIYEVKIHGPFSIEDEIREQINKSEQSMYSQNKITVEGI